METLRLFYFLLFSGIDALCIKTNHSNVRDNDMKHTVKSINTLGIIFFFCFCAYIAQDLGYSSDLFTAIAALVFVGGFLPNASKAFKEISSMKKIKQPVEFLSEEEEQLVLALRNRQVLEQGEFSSLFWEDEERKLVEEIRSKKAWDSLMEELKSYE